MESHDTRFHLLLYLCTNLAFLTSASFYSPGSSGLVVIQTKCRQERYRSLDGSCNNLLNPHWGQSGTIYNRFLPPDYGDGKEAPRLGGGGFPLPNAREISVAVATDRPMEHPHLTHLFVLWGQFINHEITNRPVSKGLNNEDLDCCDKDAKHPECLPIEVSLDDPHYRHFNVRCINFIRSIPYKGPKQSTRWREHPNNSTVFIDASTVYGSDEETAKQLRSFVDGKMKVLKTVGADLLPQDSKHCDGRKCFKAGDIRVNMFPALTALHTICMRYHNKIAEKLKQLNRHWKDEQLYQETRKILGALIQHITYNEYLPLVFPPAVLEAWGLRLEKEGYFRGYDSSANPSVASVFATAAYRFGHSMVQPRFSRVSLSGRLLKSPPLSKEFQSSGPLYMKELDSLFRGLTSEHAQNRDHYFTSQLTAHLFENKTRPGSGQDLFAINIQRGRDNGIPSYNAWRKFCGYGKFTSFDDLKLLMPSSVVKELQQLYDQVDDIDLYPAGMSEFPIEGGLLGPTFTCLIARQFQYLRQGDRFWYENGDHAGAFTLEQLREIRKMSLARVICDTTETTRFLQPQVFIDKTRSFAVPCNDLKQLATLDLTAWQEGQVGLPLLKPLMKQLSTNILNPILSFLATETKTRLAG